MDLCPSCGEARLVARSVAHVIVVAGRHFGGSVPALVCEACGEEVIRAEHIGLLELAATKWLAESGSTSPEAFRFMRKAVGLLATDLAELLGVEPETIARWEAGELPIEERAVALLGSKAIERLEGR